MPWRSARGVAPVLGSALIALAAAAPVAAQDEQERARQVYQIFNGICFECHGADAKGELDLRTPASLLKGGQSGPVVVPHQPDKSLLYKLVTHKDEPPMPRKKPKLADADIELIKDLKSRGLFESTLIVWHGEFGRLPISERMDGRDHNNQGFSVWLAGGGVKGGTIVGATDQYGYRAVENKKTVYELHATILHLLGLDYEKLTYRFNGRDMQLTDVHGKLIKEVLA